MELACTVPPPMLRDGNCLYSPPPPMLVDGNCLYSPSPMLGDGNCLYSPPPQCSAMEGACTVPPPNAPQWKLPVRCHSQCSAMKNACTMDAPPMLRDGKCLYNAPLPQCSAMELACTVPPQCSAMELACTVPPPMLRDGSCLYNATPNAPRWKLPVQSPPPPMLRDGNCLYSPTPNARRWKLPVQCHLQCSEMEIACSMPPSMLRDGNCLYSPTPNARRWKLPVQCHPQCSAMESACTVPPPMLRDGSCLYNATPPCSAMEPAYGPREKCYDTNAVSDISAEQKVTFGPVLSNVKITSSSDLRNVGNNNPTREWATACYLILGISRIQEAGSNIKREGEFCCGVIVWRHARVGTRCDNVINTGRPDGRGSDKAARRGGTPPCGLSVPGGTDGNWEAKGVLRGFESVRRQETVVDLNRRTRNGLSYDRRANVVRSSCERRAIETHDNRKLRTFLG
ncbi:hypothetical protein Bbelb_339880 [Branchiostoma belcheri]|nr:hypothetical protein Bbelb_339880 [Branchiostoma belcheri]